MRVLVDRIEDGKAALRLGEDEAIALTLPVAALPPGTREGDVLKLTLSADATATRQDAQSNARLRAKLLERSQDEPL